MADSLLQQLGWPKTLREAWAAKAKRKAELVESETPKGWPTPGTVNFNAVLVENEMPSDATPNMIPRNNEPHDWQQEVYDIELELRHWQAVANADSQPADVRKEAREKVQELAVERDRAVNMLRQLAPPPTVPPPARTIESLTELVESQPWATSSPSPIEMKPDGKLKKQSDPSVLNRKKRRLAPRQKPKGKDSLDS